MIEQPDVEEVLARFRDWLDAARAEAEQVDDAVPALQTEVREIGLYELVEQFTALRHELKLQTKSTRGLQEQTETTLASLGQAIEHFRAVEPKEAQAAWSAGKALAEALADLDEALDRGRTEIERARWRIVDDSSRAIETALGEIYASRSWLARRFCRSYHLQALEIFRQHGLTVRCEIFDALLEGYGLIQSRLQRSLKSEQIHRIHCLNRPVDAELMTVIEVVDDPEHPAGSVVEEVRRGYTWRGRLLRYAEVRASRTPAS